MARSKKSALNRRNFLRSATVGAATLAAGSAPARAQQIQPGTPRVTAPNAAVAKCRERAAETGTPARVEVLTNERPGIRLHGRRPQVPGHRVHLFQPRLQLPLPARIGDQLRGQSQSRIPHLLPRGIGGRHGPRLFQNRGQAAGRIRAWHRGPAARSHGDLQRLLRSRARVCDLRQHRQRDESTPGCGMGAQRPGRRVAGARFREVGRLPDVAHSLRRIGRASLQDRDDAAHVAHRAGGRRRSARGRHSPPMPA